MLVMVDARTDDAHTCTVAMAGVGGGRRTQYGVVGHGRAVVGLVGVGVGASWAAVPRPRYLFF